jgi:hypothetical protein
MTATGTKISREKLFKLLSYEPHSQAQWDAHRAEQRFRTICAGRRFGKSLWAGHELTLKMFVPDSINWVVGPDYGLGEKEFRVAFNDFKKLGLLSRCTKSYNVKQGNMRLYWKDNNSLLEVKSAERKDSLVGEGLDHVCMSEAAKHQLSTWQMYIEPALSDKLGSADFPSTPQGFNWYKGMYELGQQSHRDDLSDYISWRFPTWVNTYKFPGGFDPECPNIKTNDSGQELHTPPTKSSPCDCNKELIRIFNNSSRMYWLQEYCAEFTAFEGMIYPTFNEMIHVRNFEYNKLYKNWLAMDFGFVDPLVCLDVMIGPDDRVYVWREYVVSYKNNHEHAQVLSQRENPDGYHIDAIAADPRDPDAISTMAFYLGPACADDVDRSAGYEAIRRAMKVRPDGLPGLIIHPRCTELIRQLKVLRYAESKEGHNSKQVQFDGDDHGPDALRYFFNEYFILGRNMSLADLYTGNGSGTEADTFFTYTSGISLDSDFRV